MADTIAAVEAPQPPPPEAASESAPAAEAQQIVPVCRSKQPVVLPVWKRHAYYPPPSELEDFPKPRAAWRGPSDSGRGGVCVADEASATGRPLWKNHHNPFQYDKSYLMRQDLARDKASSQITPRMPAMPKVDCVDIGGRASRIRAASVRPITELERPDTAACVSGWEAAFSPRQCIITAGVPGYKGFIPGFAGDGAFGVSHSFAQSRAAVATLRQANLTPRQDAKHQERRRLFVDQRHLAVLAPPARGSDGDGGVSPGTPFGNSGRGGRGGGSSVGKRKSRTFYG
eukprot:TRINITY_DN26299_c0_g1_i3.p1 TRINITY_DN26299_c0_g1~~TRINITY_DN26299_c0_g1_i3.p1  ORF type:complete len:286 (-),score=43.57 TRINITY_DN26299_c0_g1_i3:113-970(-)